MPAVVSCTTCHRSERWTREGGVLERVVDLEGGGRRPPGDPGWARVRAAIAAMSTDGRPVGDCPVCGQLMVSEDPTLPAVAVRLDTPNGPIAVAEGGILGPHGRMTPAEGLAFVDGQYRPRITDGLVGDLGRSVFFVGLVPIVVGWVLAGLFVLSFMAALWQGTPGGDTAGAPIIDR